MSTRRTVLLAGAALTSTAAAARTIAPDPDGGDARAEVLSALEASRQAWNRGDLVAFCADYADDAVFVSPSGLTRGRAEVLARYQKKYGAAKDTMGVLGFEVLDVRPSPLSVSVAMRWSITWPQPGAPTAPPAPSSSPPVARAPASGLTVVVYQRAALTSPWRLVHDASM